MLDLLLNFSLLHIKERGWRSCNLYLNLKNVTKKYLHRTKLLCIIFMTIPYISNAQSLNENKIHQQLIKIISDTEGRLFTGVFLVGLPVRCDSIIAIAEFIKDEDSRLYGLYLKGAAFTELKDYTKAVKCFNSDPKKKKEIISGYLQNFKNYYLGVIQYRMNNFSMSMNYLKHAEEYFVKDTIKVPNQILLALIYKFKGRNYAENGVYAQAIEMYEKSIQCLKKTRFEFGVYEVYRLIGRSYFLNRQFDPSFNIEALRNFQMAIQGFKKYKMNEELPWMYTTLADFYVQNLNSRLAKLYQDSCMQMARQYNILDLIGISYNNYGEINILERKPKEAISNFKLALNNYIKSNNKGNRIITLYNLAKAYNSINMLDSAEFYSKFSIDLSLKFKNNDKIANSYQIASDVSFKKNNFKEAYFNYTQFKKFKDSVYQKQNMNIAYAMREIHETDLKEKENLMLKNENQIKKYQIKSANRRLLFIFITAVTLIIGGIFSYYNVKQRKELQLQIETQQLITEKFNIKEKTLIETERELHSLTNEIIGATKSIKIKDVQTFFANEILALENIDHKLRNIQSVLKAPTVIAPYVIKLKAFLFQQKNLYAFDVLCDIDIEIDWNVVCMEIQTHLYRITQLLLQNTNNHAKATEVGINCHIANNRLNFMYNDDGIGYDPQKSPRDRGLAEIHNRLYSINGVIKDESKEQIGCEISIEIPIA